MDSTAELYLYQQCVLLYITSSVWIFVHLAVHRGAIALNKFSILLSFPYVLCVQASEDSKEPDEVSWTVIVMCLCLFEIHAIPFPSPMSCVTLVDPSGFNLL